MKVTINKREEHFFQRRIEFCGHVIDAQGLHKTTEKIQAIVESPKPVNISQLRSFLGMLNYYQTFLPNRSAKLHGSTTCIITKGGEVVLDQNL